MIHVERNFLELKDLKHLKVNSVNKTKFLIKKIQPDFQLNKFFYKHVGKKHRWVDRLSWPDEKWISYIEDRPFNDQRYYISNQKLKDLGWKITISFNEGIKMLI